MGINCSKERKSLCIFRSRANSLTRGTKWSVQGYRPSPDQLPLGSKALLSPLPAVVTRSEYPASLSRASLVPPEPARGSKFSPNSLPPSKSTKVSMTRCHLWTELINTWSCSRLSTTAWLASKTGQWRTCPRALSTQHLTKLMFLSTWILTLKLTSKVLLWGNVSIKSSLSQLVLRNIWDRVPSISYKLGMLIFYHLREQGMILMVKHHGPSYIRWPSGLMPIITMEWSKLQMELLSRITLIMLLTSARPVRT